MPREKKASTKTGKYKRPEKLIDYFECNAILYNTESKLYKDAPRKADIIKKGVDRKILILSLAFMPM